MFPSTAEVVRVRKSRSDATIYRNHVTVDTPLPPRSLLRSCPEDEYLRHRRPDGRCFLLAREGPIEKEEKTQDVHKSFPLRSASHLTVRSRGTKLRDGLEGPLSGVHRFERGLSTSCALRV